MTSRRILAAVALLCALVAPAHAQKTKAQITTEIGTLFPDNVAGAITPLTLRTVTLDTVNSIMPTAPVVSGNLACFNGTTGLLQDCGSAPATVPLTVGATPINGGANNCIVYDLAGVLACSTTLPSGLTILSPGLTGVPTTPTAAVGASTTQIASTAFVQNNGGRAVIGVNTTVYVDPVSGNDSNVATYCPAPTTGACATSGAAMGIVANLFVNNAVTTIKFADATYTNVPFTALPWIGSGSVVLVGNIATPANVNFTISTPGNCIFCFVYTGRNWAMHGFKLSSSITGNGNAVLVQGNFSTLTYGNINFGSFTDGSMVTGLYGSHTETDAPNTISGGAACYLAANDSSTLHDTAVVNTITGTPTFSKALLCGHGAGAIVGANTTSFSGAISGLSCSADDLALIDAVASFLPGSGTCAVSFGGLGLGIDANPVLGGQAATTNAQIQFKGGSNSVGSGTASITADNVVASTAYKIGKAGGGYLLGAQRSTHGDANATLTIADCPFTQLTAGLTAPRVWQLPLSAAFPSGGWTCTINGGGGISSTNTLTITSQAGDTFSGPGVSGNFIVLSNLVATVTVVNDGSSSWSLYSVTPVSIASVAGLGTGVATALGANVGSAGAPIVNGGVLGTPSSGTLTNATGLPNAGLVNSAITISGKSTALGASYAPIRASLTPGNPTGTSSLTAVMSGLAGSFTPATSGNIKFSATLIAQNNTNGDGCAVQLRYGTGAAPANAAALTGTSAGLAMITSGTANQLLPVALIAYVTGLTVGTAYWFDISEAASTGGTCSPAQITMIAIEQ